MFDANNQQLNDLNTNEPVNDAPAVINQAPVQPVQPPNPSVAAPTTTPPQVSADSKPQQAEQQVSSPPPVATPPPPRIEPEPTPRVEEPAVVSNQASGQTDIADLINLKQKALGELSPLVDELNQSPGERFRTILMLIQATDDGSLINRAYEAAHSITDEKEKAQALLDIVNEINYFTQNKNSEQ